MARPIRKTWTESQSGEKTAHMQCNDYDKDKNSRNYEEIQLGVDKLNTVTTFKYLGSIFDSNGGTERDINNRGVTIRYPHDTIRIAILESRYDTYQDLSIV